MSSIKACFAGDMNFGNRVLTDPLKELRSLFQEVDIFCGNLEGPLVPMPASLGRNMVCWSEEKNVKHLSASRHNVYCLANNHITDNGIDGVRNTIEKLSDNNINYFGAGLNASKMINPSIIKIDELRIGFFGFGWNVIGCKSAGKTRFGVAPLKSEAIIAKIKQFEKDLDFIIVSLHFGYERERYPLPTQRRFCHRLIDNGADLIIGHHPHIVQGIEDYHGKYIVYSLGNFIFENVKIKDKVKEWDAEARESFVFQLEIRKDSTPATFEVMPVTFDSNLTVHLLEEMKASAIKDRIKKLSEPLDLDDRAYLRFWKQNRSRRLLNPLENLDYLTNPLNKLLKAKQKLLKAMNRKAYTKVVSGA